MYKAIQQHNNEYQTRPMKFTKGGVCTLPRLSLLSIPVFQVHDWNVKHIPINSETGNLRQVLAFFKQNEKYLRGRGVYTKGGWIGLS